MYIEWNNLKSLDETVNNIIDMLKERNISIYGDFIQNNYGYEYKYDTAIENFLMKKDDYINLISSKGGPCYTEEQYAGIRDFKGSLLYTRTDRDLEGCDKEKLVIIFMITAIVHDKYDGKLYRFLDVFKKAYSYINKYGYDLNWSSRRCFPFEIKTKDDGKNRKIVFLEETIVEAICNYTLFSACGKKALKYSGKELLMRYLKCNEEEINKYLNMFRAGREYAEVNGNNASDEDIYKYMIENKDLLKNK